MEQQLFITVEDFMEMAKEFSEKKMDFVSVIWSNTESGKSKATFSATKEDIDYSIDYEFIEK